MKETKTQKIEIRVSPEEKKQFKEYAENHSMTVSETILTLCQRVFAQETNN